MSSNRSRCACGAFFWSSGIHEACAKCRHEAREKENRRAYKSLNDPIPPRKFKQLTDEEVLDGLVYMVKRAADIGESSPVIHYTPDHPDFARIAAQYGG